MGRKRQRSRDNDDVAIGDSGEDEVAEEEEEDEMVVAEAEEEEEEENGFAGKQQVWDAFKEEHHEVLEQLPLSLHRQYKLMRELDGHGEAFHADLLASVRRYIGLRETLNASQEPAMEVDTRKMLQHIAQTSEEAIRTAEEKVSIAQTAYETVDRHIRLLDQAIKEQEAAISLGVRPGTHLAPILLPDLVVPRWARPPRVEHSPVPSLSPEPELHVEEPPVAPAPPKGKKGKKVAAAKPPKEEAQVAAPEAANGTAVEEEEAGPAGRPRRTGVRLTIPAQTVAPPPSAPSVPADPNEKRYCYCNQVSFGTMIGCDNKGCKLEWFHLGCTGLQEVPSKKTKWYCRVCKPVKMRA